MAGGGNRKDDLVISNSNVFAALGSLKKKKKSDKDSKSKNSSDSSSSKKRQDPEPQVFWAPMPLVSKSWGDVDDEEEDDYFGTTVPPPAVWDVDDAQDKSHKSQESATLLEDTESEDDGLDEVDDDVGEEHEPETEAELVVPVVKEVIIQKPTVVVAPKEPERQLSKKELKKKELAELEAMLAQFGCSKLEDEDSKLEGVSHDKKVENANEEVDKKDGAPGESKSAKKKKKKDKSSKEAKEQDLVTCTEVGNGSEEKIVTDDAEDISSVDVKEKMKKMASMKKKKPGKEMDAAAKAAASEAAARAAKLASAKKKEKSHYNQQPVR